MGKRFNVAGPCRDGEHYMLPPEERLTEIRPLIDEKAYFVVHAPRQTGKTTSLLSFARSLTAEGRYAAVLASCKVAEAAGADLDRAFQAIVQSVAFSANQQLSAELRPPAPESVGGTGAETRFWGYLQRWCQMCERPVVIFLDEVDAVGGATLLSILDQLHAGYTSRPEHFPHAVALIGLRDVRDYEIRGRLGSASPFNIKTDSLLVPDFTAPEVAELYGQHTAATGQRFSPAAIEAAFELSRGQPWLVNALARQIVTREAPDPAVEVSARHVEDAKEALIQQRATHLDSLLKRLREERVRRVVEAVLSGERLPMEILNDDYVFVRDLGLVTPGPQGLEIANQIYREIIPRALTALMELSLVLPRPSYVDGEGHLDVDRLMDDFRAFWIENAEAYLETAPYAEAAAQLVFMAYLHKIVNGNGKGSVDREYAAGRGRLDICVRWRLPGGGVQRWAVELKVWRDTTPSGKGIPTPVEKGLVQLSEYLERLGLDRGDLVVFDARSGAEPLPDRVAREELEHDGRRIVLWRF
jgi:hypothetical protein